MPTFSSLRTGLSRSLISDLPAWFANPYSPSVPAIKSSSPSGIVPPSFSWAQNIITKQLTADASSSPTTPTTASPQKKPSGTDGSRKTQSPRESTSAPPHSLSLASLIQPSPAPSLGCPIPSCRLRDESRRTTRLR
jgi:hypothetical protein